MITEPLTAHDDVVGIVCGGKLTGESPKGMHALLHERLEATDCPGFSANVTGL